MNRRLRSRIHEEIIQERPKRTPTKRRHHRDPKIIPPCTPNLTSIPQYVTHKPRAKISREINSIPSLPAKIRSETENQEEQREGEERSCAALAHGAGIGVVFECEDDEQEDRGGDELGEELRGLGEEGLWVCAEDYGCGGGRGRDGADPVAFEVIDCVDVVCVYDSGTTEPAEELREEIYGETPPGKLAEEAETECNRGIEEGS